jgi:predicted acetyltransferase
MDFETIGAGEVEAVLVSLAAAFLEDLDEEEAALDAKVVEPRRTLVARDGGRVVACAAAIARELTVPGGCVPCAAVTLVGVAPTHRRRGLATGMLRRQLADIHATGEAVAVLWASQGAIYGRFGYGVATRKLQLDVRTREARLRPDVERAGTPAIMAPADARARIGRIHDAARPLRPGMVARTDAWWDLRLYDPEHEREGAGRLRAAVLDDDGGYALYAYRKNWGHGGTLEGELVLWELIATTPAAAAALWGFVLEVDLVRRATWFLAPADEPLPHMLDNERAVATTSLGDGLWVRLVDVPRALRERTYSAPFDVVLEVADPVCPWNLGRYRLSWDGSGAACEPSAGVPDLELSAAELGAAYLGGTTLAELAAAGRVRARSEEALQSASVAFRGTVEPWCPELF